jgi:Ca2+-binding RTX toxin-like protein
MTTIALTEAGDTYSLASPSEIDIINALGGADSITVALNNITINGGAGNDSFTDSGNFNTWNGGDGDDRLFSERFNFASSTGLWHGDAGDDEILVRGQKHRVFGDSGNDAISIVGRDSFLDGGDGDDVLTDMSMPNAGYLNVFNGNAGNDRLNGNGAASRYNGGTGDDTYTVLGNEILIESLNAGTDRVRTSLASYALGSNFEDLVGLSKTSGQTLSGNLLDNRITGTTFGDQLVGGDGRDVLQGRAGEDSLSGGSKADVLIGGTGHDLLTGGSYGDRFDFNAISEMGVTAFTRDVITDFNPSGDVIDLSSIDASIGRTGNSAFTFIGGSRYHKVAGELRVTQYDRAGSANDYTLVAGDIDGDGISDFHIQLTGLKALKAADFIL